MRADELLDSVRATGFSNLHFDTPWAARLFGMTLAAAEKGLFTLQEFQHSLIVTISEWEDGGCIETNDQYYTCWLQALQTLLQSRELLEENRLSTLENVLFQAAQERHDHQRQGHHIIKPEAVQ